MSEFYERVTATDGLNSTCKSCIATAAKEKRMFAAGMAKCKQCGDFYKPVAKNQQFCNPGCRKAWEQTKVEAQCSVCGRVYLVKNKTVARREKQKTKPLCYSCSAKKEVYSGMSDTPMHWRECHTKGCTNRTTNYWCDECRAARERLAGADFTGQEVLELRNGF